MKYLLSLASLFFAPLLSASSGVYLGGLMGYGVMNFTPELTFTILPPNFMADLQEDFGNGAFIATPVLGYEWQKDRLRLAVEGQAFWTHINMEFVDSNGPTYNISLEHEYVLLFRPGYQLFKHVPLAAYLNVGATWATIDGRTTGAAIPAINFGTKEVWGYKVGTGLGYEFSRHWNARFDFIFSQYQNISHTAPFDIGGPKLTPITLELGSTQSQYLLGVTYQW